MILLGADGFIGRHVAYALRRAGYRPLCVARRRSALDAQGFDTLHADLTDPATHDCSFWRPHCSDAVAAINAAGLLDASEAAFRAVHVDAPKALYDALPTGARIVLISAIGIEAETPFARYRRQGEAVLQAATQPHVILRPGLVIAETSYGGTSLLRAMAAMPWRTPVVGDGTQRVNPMHAADLAALCIQGLQGGLPPGPTETGGAETLDLAELTASLRGWMGLPPAPVFRIPARLAHLSGRIGSVLKLGPISATAVAQLDQGIVTHPPPETATPGLSQTLAARPAGSQDLWHARLYLVKPLVRLTLALLWLVSALLGLFLPAQTVLASIASPLPDGITLALGRAGGLVDLGIAAALLAAWRLNTVFWLQLATVAGYTIGLTLLDPGLWLDPFGALLKNLPILVLLLIHRVLEQER